MSRTVNLTEAQGSLPELTDEANAGQTIIVANEGQELAVIIGIEEYRRLKNVESDQRSRDFNILLTPPDGEGLSEADARRIAVEAVRKHRVSNSVP